MTLTTGLIGLAALVVLGLAGQWWWATRRAERAARLTAAGADAADTQPMDRLEPTLLDSRLGDMATPDTLCPPLGEAARAAVVRRSVRIDPLVDAVVTLTPEQPVSGDLLRQITTQFRRAGTKPVHLEAHAPEAAEWELPQAGRRYDEVQIAVQLVNRHGPLNEIEYSEFIQAVQGLVEQFNARLDAPDMLDEVARGRELDSFCSQHDIQLTALLRSNSVSWAVSFVLQSAARHGFVATPMPGRLVLPGAQATDPPILTLSYDAQVALAEEPGQTALRELVLSLDVPQTPEGAEPFATWQLIARRLADDLDAVLVDDLGHPITLHAFSAIGAELERHYRTLAEHELAAGSAAARRIFS
ncbi:cell division protein ZipA C-terminal FtsZ-binding domain-containing protein [Ideonella livida]|uniref:Cell division protein FtsZ n=1 Tax=Ideonella livida TaxID=2707176 RepID=A0A7C9TGW8_9BURK|nr:cell division protein ZipA C-terminal FtsZ-binding domain-containing protein [Ideonella livida]NDY90081.1 cell division protein FtsZ [Ideonella livida]